MITSAAYKRADGKKIDGRRVVVDIERGRTIKGWKPRRLGGGKGGRKSHYDPNKDNQRGLDEIDSLDDRVNAKRPLSRERERDRDRDRDRERRRSRERDSKRSRSRSKDRKKRSKSRGK